MAEAGLKDEVSRFLVNKEVVKFDNIGVVDITLNFDLPNKLMKLAGIHGMAVQSFDGVDNPIGVRLCEINFAVLPLINKFDNFEL